MGQSKGFCEGCIAPEGLCLSCMSIDGRVPSNFQAGQKIDNVNHPNHYTQGKIEVIEYIEDSLGEGFAPYVIGNVIKYISRYKFKNGLEDLKKARWYLDRLITKMERAEKVD